MQLYYDYMYRREPTFRASRDTFDLDVQHRFRIAWPWQQEIRSRDQGSLGASTGRSTEGSSPIHPFSLWSFMTLPGHVDVDLVWRYVDSLPSQDTSSYFSLDIRLGWRPLLSLTLAVVGQNLLTDHHAEFGGGSSSPTEIERSVYGKVVWRW